MMLAKGKNMEQKRIYLACPYTHSDPVVMSERANLATQVAATLMEMGHLVFSPITQGHEICKCGIKHTFDRWAEMDLSIIKLWATEVVVLKLAGYEHSVGVQKEVAFAKNLKKPVSEFLIQGI